jgi:hypothetical protein
LFFIGAFKLYLRIVKPYFEKYEDDIDARINKVTNDAQEVAKKNLQDIAWHILLKTDRVVLDILANCVRYICNFDPSIKNEREGSAFGKSNREIILDDSNENLDDLNKEKAKNDNAGTNLSSKICL